MASIIMRAMRNEEAERISAKVIEQLYKRPCLCGCPYEDICGVKSIGTCKVARAIKKRLIIGDLPRGRRNS